MNDRTLAKGRGNCGSEFETLIIAAMSPERRIEAVLSQQVRRATKPNLNFAQLDLSLAPPLNHRLLPLICC